jgi:hypothetical protein
MSTRYLIRCAGTHRVLAWSYSQARANACATALCARLILCYTEPST